METLFPWVSHPAKQSKGVLGSKGSGLWFQRACGRRFVNGGQKGLNPCRWMTH